MRSKQVVARILGLLGLLAFPWQALAQTYSLQFLPTQNAPGGAPGSVFTVNGTTTLTSQMTATMTIKLVPRPVHPNKRQSEVELVVQNGPPDTVYTIWIVYNVLDEAAWVKAIASGSISVPATSATSRPLFPPEGNGVAPLARLDDAFTDGMGLDPGVSFVTDKKGNAKVKVVLDYDLVNDAPVGNADIIGQCTKVDATTLKTVCKDPGSALLRVTTTWLRRFIGEYPLSKRAATCANYDPRFDPDVQQPTLWKMDARRWQCVDPDTVDKQTGVGLPRVYMYRFNHFRLANHPDDLTHGFIGGNGVDHMIDMVGRYVDLVETK
jgi:hypothetical protein